MILEIIDDGVEPEEDDPQSICCLWVVDWIV